MNEYTGYTRMQRQAVYSMATKNILFVLTGILSAAFGLKSFLIPNHFIDGGVTGIALLLAQVTDVQVPIWLVIINLPFVVGSYYIMGHAFAFRAAASIAGLALAIMLIDFPDITHDKLLAGGFGGFFIGVGAGLAMRGGSVLDGTDVIAVFLSKRLHVSIGQLIMIVNIAIFGLAFLVLPAESVLYSIVAYLVAYRTVDFVIEGIEEYTGIFVISDKNNEIREAVLNDLGRGVTVFKGVRGFSDADQDILYCVVTRLEIMRIKSTIHKIDDAAFIIIHTINDAYGGVLKKRDTP